MFRRQSLKREVVRLILENRIQRPSFPSSFEFRFSMRTWYFISLTFNLDKGRFDASQPMGITLISHFSLHVHWFTALSVSLTNWAYNGICTLPRLRLEIYNQKLGIVYLVPSRLLLYDSWFCMELFWGKVCSSSIVLSYLKGHDPSIRSLGIPYSTTHISLLHAHLSSRLKSHHSVLPLSTSLCGHSILISSDIQPMNKPPSRHWQR